MKLLSTVQQGSRDIAQIFNEIEKSAQNIAYTYFPI
jgi:hypothetical protein